MSVAEILADRKRVWMAVQEYLDLMGYAPSQRDLAEMCDLSVTAINRHLDVLRACDIVDYRDNVPRSLKLLRRCE